MPRASHPLGQTVRSISSLNQQVILSWKHGANSPAEHLELRVKVPKQTNTRVVALMDPGTQESRPQHRGLSSEPQELGVTCLGASGRRLPSSFRGPRQPPSDPLACWPGRLQVAAGAPHSMATGSQGLIGALQVGGGD